MVDILSCVTGVIGALIAVFGETREMRGERKRKIARFFFFFSPLAYLARCAPITPVVQAIYYFGYPQKRGISLNGAYYLSKKKKKKKLFSRCPVV